MNFPFALSHALACRPERSLHISLKGGAAHIIERRWCAPPFYFTARFACEARCRVALRASFIQLLLSVYSRMMWSWDGACRVAGKHGIRPCLNRKLLNHFTLSSSSCYSCNVASVCVRWDVKSPDAMARALISCKPSL